LLRAFWSFVTVLFFVELYTVETASVTSITGAIVIAFAALLPSYLWCSGQALGMPIFPIFALTYLWTHAIQLVSNNSKAVDYSSGSQLLASLTVAGFLGLGTLIWFQFVNSAPEPPEYYCTFSGLRGEYFFWIALVTSILFNMAVIGGWLTLSGGLFALTRGVILGFKALAVFVLAYRSGTQELSKFDSKTFLSLLIMLLITDAASLLLVSAMSTLLIATIAFVAGRQQVPWILVILGLVCFAFLHYGKGDMRVRYWPQFTGETHYVQPWHYPAWYTEWLGYSFNNLNREVLNPQVDQQANIQSPLERSSLIQLLLMVQEKTPRDVPYLSGATYAIIPQLLVPRFLSANKIASHEGTYLLNIHYGKQTRADTNKTTIGFGLLNEAYANFGFLGCAGLAVLLGASYGQATRWSMHTPLLASRSLFAILLISFAFQSEFSAGVYIAALFQSVMPLGLITLLFMELHRYDDPPTLISEEDTSSS